MSELRHVVHSFSPIIENTSRILILGSTPSIKSEELGFYYMHPLNRFWKMMEIILDRPFCTLSTQEKTTTLKASKIALYDSVSECDIQGSSDAKMYNIKPTNIPKLIENTDIQILLANGALSYSTIIKYFPHLSSMCVKMPSTSPANAIWSLQKLTEYWGCVISRYL